MMLKTTARGLLVLALAGATLTISGHASAQQDPPSPDDCPNGYQVAFANKSYTGGAGTGPKPTTVIPKVNEIKGVGCYGRTGATTGRITLKWSTPGKIYEGIMFYQLLDCGTRKYPVTKTLEYPNGTKVNYGSGAANVTLTRGHKYQLRITGSGSFVRVPGGGGGTGFFKSIKNGNAPAWLDFGGTCM